jgi:hypothetical protein
LRVGEQKQMANFITSRLKYYYHRLYQKFHYETNKVLLNQGKMQAETNKGKLMIQSLDEVSFQVFSQRGEDGIIQYIISQMEIPNKIFIEFGVENYLESNTRFLLMNNDWSGLVIDGSKQHVRFIKEDFIYWKYDLTAYHSFITKENINRLISGYTNCKDIGLLSIDVDGNDYWIWEAIDVIQPRIVVCEYNSAFGAKHAVSVPYNSNFVKEKAHYSNLYFGASLAALCFLADKKGYDFIGTPSAGVNAFFVRKGLSSKFHTYKPEENFHMTANRDSKDKRGKHSFLLHEQRLPAIKEMPVTDLKTGKEVYIKDLYSL